MDLVIIMYCNLILILILDFEGSEWMIKKSQEVDAILNTKQAIDKGSFTESEKFTVDQIFLQALITEIFGRNEKLEDAETILQKQSKILSILDPAILTRNPLASKTYLKNLILLKQAKQGSSIANIMNTPDVIVKMEKLSLDPSGRYMNNFYINRKNTIEKSKIYTTFNNSYIVL